MTDSPDPSSASGSPVFVTIRPKGPYLVRGAVTLTDADGNVIVPPPAKTPGLIKLCSCGQSGTRPFCDGTHNRC